MGILLKEECPPVRGTKGKLLADINSMEAGDAMLYEFTEFNWNTIQTFKRTVDVYMSEIRKKTKKEIRLTWQKETFKIYVIA